MISQQNQRVWTARHVYSLVLTIFKVCYSLKYLPQLLRQLGLSYYKAVHLLVKRDNEARRKWIQETLPALYADYLERLKEQTAWLHLSLYLFNLYVKEETFLDIYIWLMIPIWNEVGPSLPV